MKRLLAHMQNAPFATKKIALAAVLACGLTVNAAYAQAQTNRNLTVSSAPVGVAAQKVQRVALVIGNGSYKDAALTNPVNDARAISQALRESGFVVINRENVDQRAMLAAVREFGDRLREGGVGVFYYAGHGMQIKGRNYLIPVGSSIEREDEVAYAAVDAQAVLDKMEAAGNGTNFMILDACRNNPFTRSFRSGSAGLAQMDAPVGTLVAFATAPGAVASDGGGQNGLYTQHLLEAMRQPGAKVEDVFKRVRAGVRRDSQGKQVPWESTSLEGDFYFHPLNAKLDPAFAAPNAAQALDRAMWGMVRDSSHAIELQAYLARFPNGEFAAQARGRVKVLSANDGQTAKTAEPEPVLMNVAQVDAQGDDVDVKRRTQALLSELAQAAASPGKTPIQAGSVTSALKQAAHAQPARNALGYAVGDRWRYQLVDKYKGEVVENWSYKVDVVLPDGDLVLNGGAIQTTPDFNFRKDTNSRFPMQSYDDHWHFFPAQFQDGATEKFKYVRTYRRRDGFEGRQEWLGTLTVKGLETVKVPAGEFKVWRLEREAAANAIQTNGTERWTSRNSMTAWYSPELRTFVAREWVQRDGNSAADRYRVELTSFEVSGFQRAGK